MKKMVVALLLTGLLVTLLPGCASLLDKDNTPTPKRLTPLSNRNTPVRILWQVRAGTGAESDYLRLTPAIHGDRIFNASKNGDITAVNRLNGKLLWTTATHLAISAGVSVNDHLVFAGSRDGTLVALDQRNGGQVWKTRVSSEILAPAAATDRFVIAKSIDGYVTAFSARTGKQLWSVFEKQPELILRGSSAPVIEGNSVFAGFVDGSLVRYSLTTGEELWKQTIASPEGMFPIQRMVDLDSDPVIAGNRVFAATWQGRIARVSANTGAIDWTEPVSTYTTLAYDGYAVYLSDATGYVQAFSAISGKNLWQQKSLEARRLTGPALFGPYLIVGDAEGWVHWINKRTGEVATRILAAGGGVYATPLVYHNVIYLSTRDGLLIACQMVP